ncbi:MAG: choice-of-anchor J domain-containing protein [Flavobacterium sp.]|nr:choice-of-anchor J domain-containing protein [Flavobacterium sp.]
MKNIYKFILLSALLSSVLTGCVSENDTDIPYLDPPPLPSIFNESFDTNFSNWIKISKTGSQTWQLDTQYGNPGSCAKMSGYSNGYNANVDWLISPAQDFSAISSAKLDFDNAYKHTGAPIEVYVSNNYSGAGDPEVAGVTWTKINGAVLSPGDYTYVNSDPLDISAFTGTGNAAVYIAFKYTSTTSEASTWELDNINVTE